MVDELPGTSHQQGAVVGGLEVAGVIVGGDKYEWPREGEVWGDVQLYGPNEFSIVGN